MRVLVLGAGGQVARAVARVMSGQHELIARTRAELDIADAAVAGSGPRAGQSRLDRECRRLYRGRSRGG